MSWTVQPRRGSGDLLDGKSGEEEPGSALVPKKEWETAGTT